MKIGRCFKDNQILSLFLAASSQSALLIPSMTPGGVVRISYHLMPRRDSNSRQRVAPDWDLSDAMPTELQHRGSKTQNLTT